MALAAARTILRAPVLQVLDLYPQRPDEMFLCILDCGIRQILDLLPSFPIKCSHLPPSFVGSLSVFLLDLHQQGNRMIFSLPDRYDQNSTGHLLGHHLASESQKIFVPT